MSKRGFTAALAQRPWLAALVALAAVFIYDGVLIKGFYSFSVRDGNLYGNVIDIVHQAAPTMLVGLGMTLVIATGGVDLSVGAVMAISGALVAVLLSSAGLNPYLAMALAVGAGALCGLWNGALVALLRVQPIVATLILMVAGRGIAQLLTDGQIISIESSTVN